MGTNDQLDKILKKADELIDATYAHDEALDRLTESLNNYVEFLQRQAEEIKSE